MGSRALLALSERPAADTSAWLRQPVDAGHSARAPARGPGALAERLHHVVDTGGEGGDVVGLDGGEHAHPELVAAELAVRIGVDDAVGPQGPVHRGVVDGVVEVRNSNAPGAGSVRFTRAEWETFIAAVDTDGEFRLP